MQFLFTCDLYSFQFILLVVIYIRMSKFKRAQQSLTFAHQWLLYDARHQDVFDSANKIATYLRGQNKPIYSRPDQWAGDHVIVINTKG